MRKPLLVMHSPQDTIVEIENAANIYQAAWHPQELYFIGWSDHLLSNKRDSGSTPFLWGAIQKVWRF